MNNILFIAEVGNNHNGDVDRAIRLIDCAKKIGCDVVKFQLRNFASLYRNNPNIIEDLGVEYTKDLLKKYEISDLEHSILAEYCEQVGIEYMCTPWDLQSVDFLESLDVKRYKIASADFDNLPLIEKIIETEKPLILSTGMATTAEIQQRTDFLKTRTDNFTLLHCNSTYPAPFEDIELNFLKTMQKIWPSIGYSGHERGIAVSLAAIALGSKVIERHITEDRDLEGPDHSASLLPNEFAKLIEYGDEIKKSLGRVEVKQRKLSQGTLLNRENLGKSIVARHGLKKDQVLTLDDMEIKAPGQGLSPMMMSNLVGGILREDIAKEQFILEKHFKSSDVHRGKISLNSQWGIPVRPHDVKSLHNLFDAPVYEFHISYQDLERPLPNEDWDFLKSKIIIVHCPELFENSKLLDLCDYEDIDLHINNLNRVCAFSRKIVSKANTNQNVKIVTNIGGFSLNEFKPTSQRKSLYQMVANNLDRIKDHGCEIIIQNMAPFPWHFGGQRYQNIFMHPNEILEFCMLHRRRITLDTAHLSMNCKYTGEDFIDALKTLIPVVTHWHMSDSEGTNGEGVKMGAGDINFSEVVKLVSSNQSYIVETWQGHKSDGLGFYNDLKFLMKEGG